MPLNRREFIQFSFLIFCVPAQYLVCKYFGNDDFQRNVALKRLLTNLWDFKRHLFELGSWWKWPVELISLMRNLRNRFSDRRMMGESCAIEIMEYRGSNTGYFAESPEIRTPRPKHVKYRIGQVIMHRKRGYRGVIVGWDLEARAPQTWLYQNYPNELVWPPMPHYLILVDTRDRLEPQRVYLPEDSFLTVQNMKIIHPNVYDYFDTHDGAQYIPRPSLRLLYPHD